MTAIETLWQSVEEDAKGVLEEKWVLRRVLPHGSHDLSIGLETPDGRRLLVLRTHRLALPAVKALPDCRGLETFVRHGASADEGILGVALKERRYADVFSALIADLANRVEAATSAADAVVALLGQLRRWQAFLAAAAEALSEEAQRGLWGELHFLREELLPAFGPAVVAGWQGSRAAHQDFQFVSGAVEVKTSAAKGPQTVHIASERQLDDTGVAALFLHHLSLDAREDGGESLPAMIESVRVLIASDAGASEQLEEGLLAAGWLNANADRYSTHGYTVRETNFFQVTDGFPRIVEGDLPDGIGHVSYLLSIAACKAFAIAAADVLKTLAGSFPTAT